MCPPSTACRAGMCVCEGQPLSGNYRSLATGTSNQGIQHFPEPKIAAFIDEHRFVCEVPRTAGGDCPEGSLRRGELDPAYPSEAPHYVVAYPDTSDNIQLLLLSERGDVLEVGTISAPTLQAPGGQLIDIRLEQSADGLLLFAWWRGGFGTTQYEEFVQAYNIITPADGGVEGQSLPRQGQGSLLPRQPISLDPSTLTGLMLDFSFAQTEPFMGPGGRILQLTSMPYFVSEVNDDGDQPTLEIKTRIAMYVTVDGNDPFKLPINTNNVGLTGVTAATDFAHELYVDSQGRIVLTLTSYEPLPTADEPDSTVAPRNRTHKGLTYTRKSFSVQLTLNDLMAPATLIEFDARDLTEGKVPTPSEDSTVFEDRSNLPAPINITRRGSSDFTALGWTFWSKTVGGGPEEFFSRLIVNDISSATSAITSALELPKRFIFDQAFPRRPVTTSPDSPRLVIWAETGIHPMSKKPVRDISSVRFTTARLKGPNAPEIPGPKALSSPGAFGTTFPVQTVDAQAGTRSVGVIAHGQNTKNTITPSDDVISLYFYVIVGDRPVCQFRGTPSTGP